jgi:pimeloyl-ACP methyl ester carboxylesterase
VALAVVDLGFATAPVGARLAFQLRGPADAPPLLLLQGQSNSHRWWKRLRVPFARGFRTITFDYRGTGRTECEIGDWSTASFAADAATVLDHLGFDRVPVYGTSMGGRVAQMLALDRRISRLALACTSPGGPHARERGPEVRKALSNPDWPTRRATLLDLMYTPEYAKRHGDASTLLGDPSMSSAASLRHLRVSARHDAYDRLPEIDVPVLVLHGSDDRMAPVENAHLIAAQLPHAEIHITERGRHGFFDEFAQTVTPRVTTFLAG